MTSRAGLMPNNTQRKSKMNTPKMTLAVILSATILGLAACAKTQIPIASMSCTDIAREIGKATQARDDATVDSAIGLVEMLASDNQADEILGSVNSIAGDLTGAAVTRDLRKLNRAFAVKGCR